MPGCLPCWDMEQPGTGTLSGLPLLPIPLTSRDDLGSGQANSASTALCRHPLPAVPVPSHCAVPPAAPAAAPRGCAGCLCPKESCRLGSGRSAGAFWQQDRSLQGSTCPGDVGELMEGCGARDGEPAPDTAANPLALREESSYHGGLLHLLGLPVLWSPHVTSEETPGLRENGACQEPEELKGCEKTPVPPNASWPAWLLPACNSAELSCCLEKPEGWQG